MKLKLVPTYYFGKGVVDKELAKELQLKRVKTVLLAYGGGSIKRNGLYHSIVKACKQAKVKLVEHAGIEPNPRDVGIYLASQTCRKHKVDLIIAAGGGSVIDAAKVIGILATNPQYKNTWSYVLDQSKVKKPSIPLFSIITLAATASENNASSVVTNSVTHFKMGVVTPSALPLVCFEDPEYTMTLSFWQTACGIFDIFSHLTEGLYDVNRMFNWTREYIYANMRVCLNCAQKLIKNNHDHDARANLLWTSSWALNGLSSVATAGGDWMTHRLEHAVSGLWDVEHGAGLALIFPTYIRYMDKTDKRFAKISLDLAKNVFEVNSLEAFYKALDKFIMTLKLPKKYTDFQQIGSVTAKDIQWLNNHFNKVVRRKEKATMAKYVFDHIKK